MNLLPVNIICFYLFTRGLHFCLTFAGLPQVDKYLHRFLLSYEDLMEISIQFRREMDKGLCRDTNPTAAVRMLPTFVRSTPDGTGERKKVFANVVGSGFKAKSF